MFYPLSLQYTELATHKIHLNIQRTTSSQSHDGIHLKILPTLLKVLVGHLSYCCRKGFYEGYDKINEFSNFKCNLFQFSNPYDTTTELYSRDTFLRT